MKIAATKPNAGLANVVNSRLSADARMVNAKAALWILGGIGLAAFGIGAGVAVAVLAYARLNDRTFAASQIADILASSLRDTKLTTTIDPGSTVRLESGSEVKLASGSEVTAKGTVSLDPNARVAVSGRIGQDLPRPTANQLNMGAAPQTQLAATTNYTIFKQVAFGKGFVVTGYKFVPEAATPESQYCYYSENAEIENTSIKIDIGTNGRFIPSTSRKGFDAAAAARNCVWFDGSATAF